MSWSHENNQHLKVDDCQGSLRWVNYNERYWARLIGCAPNLITRRHKRSEYNRVSSTTMFQKRIHKRVRFEADPILDREDSVTSEDEINKLTHESEVLEEDPLDAASGFGEAIVLSEKDFWDHVYSNVWSGRLRVCEGNLLRTLIRVRACSYQSCKKRSIFLRAKFSKFA